LFGGGSSDFLVKFLSNNHFRFSVFSKEVGFYVYNLQCVTTSFFDVYFHLWNNGTPHWEREKRAWEIEQEKEWTLVLSKSSKKEVKRKENLKRVHFAKPIVQPPPKNNHQPSISLIFGSFSSQFDPSSLSQRMVFGPSSILRRDPIGSNGEPKNMAPPMPRSDDPAPFPNSKSLGCLLKCFHCLDLGHTRRYCRSKVRCAQCFNFGHVKRRCPYNIQHKPIWIWTPNSAEPKLMSTQAEPRLVWRPKKSIQRQPEPTLEQCMSSHSHVLDPRAGTEDSSASLNLEKDQVNFQSNTNLQHKLDFMDLASKEQGFLSPTSHQPASPGTLPQPTENPTSTPPPLADGITANPRPFLFDNMLIDNILIFNMNSLLSDIFARATVTEGPIVVNKEAVQTALAALPSTASTPKGLEIVPWKPVPAVIALQL
jgi:hypothetical protein